MQRTGGFADWSGRANLGMPFWRLIKAFSEALGLQRSRPLLLGFA